MSHSHHHRNHPPTFQPQPSWGGFDFFRAHASNPDRSLYDHARSRAQNSGSYGVGKREAKHYHQRAYGSAGELSHMRPAEIGHAAAYEAYRTWTHNSSMREPLSGDKERQREGFIGYAIAEATRLLEYSGRTRGSYDRMEASESSAATASIIFQQMMERGRYDDHSRSRSRHGSFSSSTYAPPMDPYFDNSGHRSRSRHRSSSRHPDHHDHHVPYSAAGAIPIPGTSVVVPTYGGGSGSYGHRGAYGGGAMPISAHGSPGAYRGRSGFPMQIPAYHGSPTTPLAVPMTHSRHRSSSMSVPYAPEYPGMMGQQQVILEPAPAPRRSHRHQHHDHHDGHSHSHGRARSSEPPIMYGGGYSSSARY